jgi:hypothetical protein
MTADSEGRADPLRVHGGEKWPGDAAGRTVLFTGLNDPADVFWLSVMVGMVTWLFYVLSWGEVAGKVVLAVMFLVWLSLLWRFCSPFKVLVGLEEVTEWRWTGRRSLPMREAVAAAHGRRHCSMVVRRRDALAKGLDRALLTASEWLLETRDGERYRGEEDGRALDAERPPMAILAVGERVVPVDRGDVWLEWRVAGGSQWRIDPDKLRAATAGASVVLVPRSWDPKYLHFKYDEPLLLAGPGSDVEAIRARLRELY